MELSQLEARQSKYTESLEEGEVGVFLAAKWNILTFSIMNRACRGEMVMALVEVFLEILGRRKELLGV